jgi:hypothetical protein
MYFMSHRMVMARLLAAGVFFAHSLTQLAAQEQVDLKKISRAWKDRQDRLRTGRFSWTVEETIPKGFLSTFLAGRPGARQRLEAMGIAPGEVVPPEDVTFQVRSSVTLDGLKIRYEREGRQWSGKKRTYVPQPYVAVFDGKVGKSLYANGSPSTPWPQASTHPSYPSTPTDVIPLFMTFRPGVPGLRDFDIGRFHLTGQQRDMGGGTVLELEQRSRNSVGRVCVDPSRDFVIRSVDDVVADVLVRKIVIEYRFESGMHIPAQWSFDAYNSDGSLQSSLRAKLLHAEINPPIQPAEFTVEFKPGSRVTELVDRKGRQDYLIKENGAKRKIMASDVGASYEELMNSEPGRARQGDRAGSSSWRIALSVVLAALAGSLFLWRMRRHA